jgi:hypothetical protein
MELLKKRVRKNHSSVLSQDSRRHAKLLAYLHSASRIIMPIIFLLSPLSLGDIHDGRNGNVVRGHGIKANLNGELASVFSRTKQVEAHSHGTHPGSGSEFLSQTSVFLPKACWNQYLSRPAY